MWARTGLWESWVGNDPRPPGPGALSESRLYQFDCAQRSNLETIQIGQANGISYTRCGGPVRYLRHQNPGPKASLRI